MVIRNVTKNAVLADNAIFAKSFKHKAFGLILASKGTSMIFQTRFGIHAFFMKYPIDVLILNNQNTVMIAKQTIKPNHLFLWNPTYSIVIELPAGTIETSQTTITDSISY
jgi:uncharacterized membrane protein (UPF0127 family)